MSSISIITMHNTQLPSFEEFIRNTFDQKEYASSSNSSISSYPAVTISSSNNHYYYSTPSPPTHYSTTTTTTSTSATTERTMQQQQHMLASPVSTLSPVASHPIPTCCYENAAVVAATTTSVGTPSVDSRNCINRQQKPKTKKQSSLKRGKTPVEEFNRLNAEIMRQQGEISRLIHENDLLKTKKRKIDNTTGQLAAGGGGGATSPQPSANNYSNRNSPPPIEFTVIVESSLNQSKQDIVQSNVDDYLVTWNGLTYVISNIFTNKDDISHFYCPRFESYYPKKDYKVVVEKNEYRQLLSENSHIIPLFKKRAWRVSLFTMDFVNFVKECNQNGNEK